MRSAVYLADLTADNARLMPWRVALEVAASFRAEGRELLVLSGRDIREEAAAETIAGIEVHPVPRAGRDRRGLAAFIRKNRIGRLFYPIAFARSYGWAAGFEAQTGCRIVWYLPGGWYGVRQCLAATRELGWRKVLPYWIQALCPKRIFFRSLRRGGVRGLICFSEYSARMARRRYPESAVFTALPGKDPVPAAAQSDGFRQPPYFLFFGPPNKIRGVADILRAFAATAESHPDAELHLCFRADGNVPAGPLRTLTARNRAAARIVCRWGSLTPEELHDELSHCCAVLKPFLIVPSEIPLAVIEAAAFGKPVIGTGPDGTGDYLSAFGLTARHGNWRMLARAMDDLLRDHDLYQQKARNAREVYAGHPTWPESAAVWAKAAEYRQ